MPFMSGDGHKAAKRILPAGHYIVAKRHRAERDTCRGCNDGVPPLAACVAYSTITFVILSRYLTNDNGIKRGEQQRRDAVATSRYLTNDNGLKRDEQQRRDAVATSRYLTNDNGLKRDEQRRRDAVVITLPKAALHARSAIQS